MIIYHHTHNNITVSLSCIHIPVTLVAHTSPIEKLLAEVGHPQLPNVLQSIEHLRPWEIPQLPILPPRVPPSPAGPLLGQIPQVRDHSTNFQFVQTWSHAQALWTEFTEANNQKGKTAGISDCPDLPHAPAQQLAMVGELVEAAFDYDSMQDKKTKSRKKNASDDLIDSPQVTRVKMAPNVIIELICWKLLVSRFNQWTPLPAPTTDTDASLR